MKWSLRFALGNSFLVILLLLLKRHLKNFWDQHSVGSYIRHSWKNSFHHGSVEHVPAFHGKPGDKVIIMAKLEKDETSWVTELLPEYTHKSSLRELADQMRSWQAAVYTVNPTTNYTSALTTPMNKGHEGRAYLSYIIDNYENLPSTLAFLHSHRNGFFAGWHTDTPLYDNVDALRKLQLDFVLKIGYVNLRCN